MIIGRVCSSSIPYDETHGKRKFGLVGKAIRARHKWLKEKEAKK